MNTSLRREKLVQELTDKSVVVLYSGSLVKRSADGNYPFSVNRNFFYLTNIDEQEVYLVLYKEDNQLIEKLFIKKSDQFMEKWMGKSISVDEAKQYSMIDSVYYHEDLEQEFENIKNKGYVVYLDQEKDDFEEDHYNHSLLVKKHPVLAQLDTKDIYKNIAALRLIKTDEEIEELKKAIAITNEGLMAMFKKVKPDMKEYEMVAHYNYVLSHYNSKFAFSTIAASGETATTLHYEKNNKVMKDKELVLLDLGATSNNYCADISRTIPVNGVFTPRQKQLYNIVLLAQENVEKSAKPGVSLRELQMIVVETYYEQLKNIGLVEHVEDVKNYYYHGVSHLLGLDTHDVYVERDTVLQEGMVITNEPGLYIAEEHIGIRIEDDLLITKDGCENLSRSIIKTVDEIEQFMKG